MSVSLYECGIINNKSLSSLSDRITNEYASETWLEMAIRYYKLGLIDEALTLLENAPESVTNNLWLSELYREKGNKNEADLTLQKVTNASPELVFPYRRETFDLLQKIVPENKNWKLKYYIALIAWSKNSREVATSVFNSLESTPDFTPFYLTRAKFFEGDKTYNPLDDLLKAKAIAPNDWRVSRALIVYYRRSHDITKALSESKEAAKKHKSNFVINYEYAKSLLENRQFNKSLKVLENITILPAEGARSIRTTYRQASLMLSIQYYQKKKYKTAMDYVAKARLYPEELGTGRPYVVDERIEDYLEALCLSKMELSEKAHKAFDRIVTFTISINKINNSSDYISMLTFDYVYIMTLQKMGKENEISSYFKNWKKRSHNGLMYQWSEAIFNKDESKAKELEAIILGEENSIWSPNGNVPTILLTKKLINSIE